MTSQHIPYLIFAVVVSVALIFDLGLLSKKNHVVTIRQALYQTLFWVALGLSFGVYVWVEKGRVTGLEYVSAYLMEWSLSIDNIFVFILVFNAFAVKERNYGQVLLLGILMAIVLRIVFITGGVALVNQFHQVLYLFGAFLVYTGCKIFLADVDEEFDPHETKVYRFMAKVLPMIPGDHDGRYTVRDEHGKRRYTVLFVVVMMLAAVDLAFAVDSIPAVMGLVDNSPAHRAEAQLVIYTSNIFAVLGLRSLFFLLRGSVNKFEYLQQGIAVVLVFIGVKMLGEHWINQWLDKGTQVIVSLLVIVVCLAAAMAYSVFRQRRGLQQEG
jgi:tellurite resistance protein TerC